MTLRDIERGRELQPVALVDVQVELPAVDLAFAGLRRDPREQPRVHLNAGELAQRVT
jgi:hypothetical protein